MEKVRLGDICVLHYGKSLTANKRINGNVPVYSSAGLIGYHNVPLVNNRGIIIGRKGTVGKVYKTDKPFYCIDTAFYILPDDDVYDFDYLYYCLKSLGLENLNEDSAVPGLNRETAYSQLIYFPKIEIQKKIAKILSDIDVKIKNNNKINDNLKELSKIYFLNLHTKSNDLKKITDIAVIKYGKGLLTNKFKESGYPVFGGNGIIGYYKDYIYEYPQILIACRGAASGKVIISDPFSFITNNSLVLELKDRRYFEFLKQYFLLNQFYQYKTGSAQPQITIDNIKHVKIPYPVFSEIVDASNMFSNISNMIYKNDICNLKLIKLRDYLLEKLITGKIDISKLKY